MGEGTAVSLEEALLCYAVVRSHRGLHWATFQGSWVGRKVFPLFGGFFGGLQISTKTEGSLVLFGGIPASIMWSSFLSVPCARLMSEPIGLWDCNDYRYDLYDDSMA